MCVSKNEMFLDRFAKLIIILEMGERNKKMDNIVFFMAVFTTLLRGRQDTVRQL